MGLHNQTSSPEQQLEHSGPLIEPLQPTSSQDLDKIFDTRCYSYTLEISKSNSNLGRSNWMYARYASTTRGGTVSRLVKVKSHSRHRKAPFAAILTNVRSENIRRLKDRAFIADSLARIFIGPSRGTCSQLKNDVLEVLLRLGAVSLQSIDSLPGIPTIGQGAQQ